MEQIFLLSDMNTHTVFIKHMEIHVLMEQLQQHLAKDMLA